MNDSQQTAIDPFRELNRYDGRDEDWPSDAVFEPPRRTVANGWRKFHAARDCGFEHVRFTESNSSGFSKTGRYDYSLRCPRCGYQIPEDEVLFIGGQWYEDHGIGIMRETVDNLWLPRDRVVDLGPDPDEDELLEALRLTKIEADASYATPLTALETEECEDCGNPAPMLFDGRCRMCYDGPWTDRMQGGLNAFERTVREWHNNSFVHRLPRKVDPLSAGSVPKGRILWRRHDFENTSKLVEVTQRLEDTDSGHMEYVLWDPTHSERWQYHEDDLRDCFWDTGLTNEETKPVLDDRIRELHERVSDR